MAKASLTFFSHTWLAQKPGNLVTPSRSGVFCQQKLDSKNRVLILEFAEEMEFHFLSPGAEL